MKRIFILVFGVILAMPSIYSQTGPPWTEDFDGNTISFTATPSNNAWVPSTVYYLPGTDTKSILGLVPTQLGNSITLETPIYSCVGYDHVLLRFSHICKVSPYDNVRVEYSIGMGSGMGPWEPLPVETYLGNASTFQRMGSFNAASYSEWDVNDSSKFPTQDWWREETFDLTGFVNQFTVRFRFVITRGQVAGTQASYGWLIDHFQLFAANKPLTPPSVEFVAPLINGELSGAGPWEINANVKTNTYAPLKTVQLKWTATNNGVAVTGSTPMTLVSQNDNLWKAAVPQFVAGNSVVYSISGEDTLGNVTTIISSYTIVQANENALILQDGGINSSSAQYPFNFNWGYTRSMALYPASEMSAIIAGDIYTIAMRVFIAAGVGTNNPGALPLKIWLKTVAPSKTQWSSSSDNIAWSTLTSDATLVYEGEFHFNKYGWMDIPLDNTFYYNGTDNLVVMIELNCGGGTCTNYFGNPYPAFYYSTTQTDRLWMRNFDNNISSEDNTSSALTVSAYRPDLRIGLSSPVDPNSAAIYSIDLDDIIVISSGDEIPIKATVKNKGSQPLSSVKIGYSVNGINYPEKTLTFNTALAWDFNYQDSLGKYKPKLNGYDTIKVWISMPNNSVDATTWDDVLTKNVYGSSDIVMQFVEVPKDTVNATGPHEITAEIYSRTGASFTPLLYVESLANGGTTYDTIPMVNTSGNLWKVNTPTKVFESDVHYAIKMIDVMSNLLIIEDSYYIKRLDCSGGGGGGSFVLQETPSVSINRTYPFILNYGYSRSMVLYKVDEISADVNGLISKIGLNVKTVGSGAIPIKVWLKTVPATTTAWNATADNLPWATLTQDATLVYDDFFHFDQTGWVDIPLTTPFLYLHTDNLVVMFEQNCTGGNCSAYLASTSNPNFYYSSVTGSFWYRNWDNNITDELTRNPVVNAYRPDLRVEVTASCPDSNSVALVSIDSPVESGLIGGNTYPIRISLRNKGLENLTSCNISWKINNGAVTTVTYNRNLPEEVIDTITIGTFTPQALKEDVICVWVSMPNGQIDSTLTDDTLTITRMGCFSPVSGVVQVGAGKTYTTINQVLNAIRNCGVTGDVIMELTGTFNENVNLTDFATYMQGNNLTITSANNNVDNAVIAPSSGNGITLSNMRNLTLRAITVKPVSSGISAILFEGPCDNITIRDCKLILDTTSTATTGGVIYKGNNGVANNITVVNNLLEGGNAGFYFYAGTGNSLYGTPVVFDSNTVRNNRSNGVYFYYANITSCSYNTIECRTVNSGTSWNPLDINYSNGDITYNRITNRGNSEITSSQGIYSNNHNYYLTSTKALIANNEIIHTNMPAGTGGIYAGIWAYPARAEVLHNSIYMSGDRDVRAMYLVSSSNDMIIMNNDIVVISSIGYPFHFGFSGSSGTYNIDYNNIYGSTYIAGTGSANYATLVAWKNFMPSDLHSVSVLTPFADDPPTNLKPISYRGLSCPSVAAVSDDIEKESRTNITAMGAYTIPAYSEDLTLLDVSSWQTTLIAGQTVKVNVNVLNTGTDPVTDATFGWSVNGDLQNDVPWTATTPLTSYQQENNIPIGTFQVDNATTFEVVIWIKSVNGQASVVLWNDTISVVSTDVIPMAEFVAPLVGDTISTLSFEVYANISNITGAPANGTYPILYLEAITDINAYHIFDSVVMMFTGGVWKATVPKQYYASNVIYTLVVTDTTGYTFTVSDTVYIKYPDFGRVDVTIIGTGSVGGMSYEGGWGIPIYPAYDYNWSRSLYLFDEVCASGSVLGTYIKAIAWQSNNVSGSFTNQTCFMRATDSVSIGGGYVDPLNPANNFQQVWTGTLHVFPNNWAELTLDVPFYLPYGKNLDIVWHNEQGTGSGIFGQNWYQTETPGGAIMSAVERGTGYLSKTSDAQPKATRTNLKVTTEDGTAFDPYEGNNLGLVSIVSPINREEETCLSNFLPVRVTLRNLGQNRYDFSIDSITLHAEIIDPYQTKWTLSTVVNTGELVSSEMRPVELSSSFPLMDAGQYQIKMWVESSIDQIVYDDTLYYVYETGRAGLPIEDDFSSGVISDKFVNRCIVPEGGTDKWEPYIDPSSIITPPEGSGILRYVGSYGTQAQLKTRQLDLYRVVDPKLTFWYYYDNTASDLDNSYTEVSVVVDETPIIVRTLFRRGATTGWVKDSIDLTPYINYQCVYVQFEAMNKYNAQSAQYLSFISLTSTPDLSVSSILISPEVALCDFASRDLYVVLSTTMNQTIDFSIDEPDLEVVVGSQTYTYPLRGSIQGNSSDTFLIQSDIDLTGITNIKAYLTVPMDRYALNDTANYVIDIQPKLSLTVKSFTEGVNCIRIGDKVRQEITLKNEGNVNLSGIQLELRITAGDNYSETVTETNPINLSAGKDTVYLFDNAYTVPAEAIYQVLVTAKLGCDPSISATNSVDNECADMHDVLVSELIRPSGEVDNSGSVESISVSVENKSNTNRFLNIPITAVIEDENGQRLNSLQGNISVIEASSTIEYTFQGTYTVPSDISSYSIRVYISKVDNYPENDTIVSSRTTKDVGINTKGEINAFTLKQNIPNPANKTTRIDYSVPEAGEVIFYVHSISGQLLYSKTIDTKRGTNSIELNTTTFAAGVYFYSMEYKGQRLVKQLIINATN